MIWCVSLMDNRAGSLDACDNCRWQMEVTDREGEPHLVCRLAEEK